MRVAVGFGVTAPSHSAVAPVSLAFCVGSLGAFVEKQLPPEQAAILISRFVTHVASIGDP